MSEILKPYVIVHMSTSIDGRTIPSRWRPESPNTTPDYDRVHNQLGGDAWVVGRTTGAEFAKQDAYRPETSQSFPRQPWFSRSSPPPAARRTPRDRYPLHAARALPLQRASPVGSGQREWVGEAGVERARPKHVIPCPES